MPELGAPPSASPSTPEERSCPAAPIFFLCGRLSSAILGVPSPSASASSSLEESSYAPPAGFGLLRNFLTMVVTMSRVGLACPPCMSTQLFLQPAMSRTVMAINSGSWAHLRPVRGDGIAGPCSLLHVFRDVLEVVRAHSLVKLPVFFLEVGDWPKPPGARPLGVMASPEAVIVPGIMWIDCKGSTTP